MSEPLPCYQRPEPFDTLIDAVGDTRANRHAAMEAYSMCRRCRVQVQCFIKNDGESWVDLIRAEAGRQARLQDGAA